MLWRCPRCGFEGNATDSRTCSGGCGHVRFHRRVILTSVATNLQLAMSIDTVIGRRLLRRIGQPEEHFASEPQCRIFKDSSLGGWAVEHEPTATHPTYCNGVSIHAGPVLLHDGSVLSIGLERMRLQVRLED